MDKNIQFIAGGLAVFFLIVAIVKSAISKSQKRKLANRRAAEASGGTEDSPIQLFDPFAEEQTKPKPPEPVAPTLPPANATAQASVTTPVAAPEAPKNTEVYKWN